MLLTVTDHISSYHIWFFYISLYSASDAMLKERIKSNALLHNPNFLLARWKDLAEMNQKKVELLKNHFLVKLCGKEIYGASGPNISLPENMVRCTYI